MNYKAVKSLFQLVIFSKKNLQNSIDVTPLEESHNNLNIGSLFRGMEKGF